jgi:carboxylesterase
MHYIGRRLHRNGYSVCMPYLRGCGALGTPSRFQTSRWELWLGQVETHFEELKRDHAQVSVAGLCIGANLALALALERSADIHALCLYSTTLYYDGWNVSRLRFLRALAYYTPLRFVYSYPERAPYGLKDERIRQWVAAQMKKGGATAIGAPRSPMTGIYQAERMMRYLRRHLRQVTTPTLILHAQEDDTASTRSAELVNSCISSSIVRKVILNNSYHNITMDNDKDCVLNETLSFIAQQAGRQLAIANLQI